MILSATQDAARRLTESIGPTLTRSSLTRGAVVDDYATRIRLTNDSEIISLPASQRQVRGYGEGVLLTILDEAAFMPEELWTAARYTALDERRNGSRLLLLGTPFGDNFFRQSFEAGQRGDPDFAAFHWTYKANPNLDHSYLERERERVPAVVYANEILGEWTDALDSPFAGLLEPNTADIEIPTLSTLGGPAQPMMGLDIGVSKDRSACVGIARLPVSRLNTHRPQRSVFGVVMVHVWPQATRLAEVVSDVLASPAPLGRRVPRGVGCRCRSLAGSPRPPSPPLGSRGGACA